MRVSVFDFRYFFHFIPMDLKKKLLFFQGKKNVYLFCFQIPKRERIHFVFKGKTNSNTISLFCNILSKQLSQYFTPSYLYRVRIAIVQYFTIKINKKTYCVRGVVIGRFFFILFCFIASYRYDTHAHAHKYI